MFEENRNSLDAVTLQIFKKVENQTCMREIFGPSSLTKKYFVCCLLRMNKPKGINSNHGQARWETRAGEEFSERGPWFLNSVQWFSTMPNTFFQGSEKFCEGASPSWLPAWPWAAGYPGEGKLGELSPGLSREILPGGAKKDKRYWARNFWSPRRNLHKSTTQNALCNFELVANSQNAWKINEGDSA